jgi:hypothetical protein
VINDELVLPVKELSDGDMVAFSSATQKYGHAEFTFCPVWKRRKLDALYIFRRQQENVACSYVIRSGYSTALAVGSWTHQGVTEPRIWRHWWCRDHKCMAFDCYVPINSDRFTVRVGSDISVYFELKESLDVKNFVY